MNSSETEQIGAGGKTVKMEPASDVADAEPIRQVVVKMEATECMELNENVTNPKPMRKATQKRFGSRRRRKWRLRQEALAKDCASTNATKVDASTQTVGKMKEKRYRGKRISSSEGMRRKLRRAQTLNFKQMVKKTLNAEIKQLVMIKKMLNDEIKQLVNKALKAGVSKI
uniref:Uncharacterized protein n=1 Tax=Meloidogyne incognita TaxID=6306 RepID=A0A914N0C1_MELIC